MIPIVPLILAVALFMEQMDSTVIATSLPAIASDIGTSPVALKLAITSYFVALSIFIPISGWMSDRFGAKTIFRLAILVFMVGSVACAFSGSLQAFVLSRFLQGIGGSMMTPVGRLLLVRATPRTELVSAMAWLTIPALVGPIMGPPLGGLLTTYLSWHWVFWINVPIGLLGLALVTRYLPAGEPRSPGPLDLPGFLLTSISFTGLVFGMSVISLPAVPISLGYVGITIGIVAGAAYLRHARRTTVPLLDPRLLRFRLFRAGIVGGSVFRIGIGAIPFLLPLMLQLGFGLNPFQSGMITFVTAVGALTSKFLAQRVFRMFGFRTVLGVGALCSALFTAIYGLFTPTTLPWVMMGFLLVGGSLRSICFTGINAMVFADIDDADSAQATAINAVAQQLSLATGVALAGGILDIAGQFHGGGIAIGDFHIAFFGVAILSGLSAFIFLGLPRDAGAVVSGHRRFATR